ncbi:MAG TPA: response regulator [Brevundimonas sp.]|nr:response regulator [Brevundimonas sp.]
MASSSTSARLSRATSGVGETLRESAVINLTGAVTMVVDDSPFALDLTTQALLGFGIRTRYACNSGAEAMAILRDHPIDLLIVDCEMPDMDGYALVRWLRRSGLDPNAFAPVIMTAAHVRRSKVSEARDCGANFVVTKPFSASTLLERLVWIARDTRPFLEVGDYFGPDRRFRPGEAPGEERRANLIRKAQFEAERAAAYGGDA